MTFPRELYVLRQITQLANADFGIFPTLTPVVLSHD